MSKKAKKVVIEIDEEKMMRSIARTVLSVEKSTCMEIQTMINSSTKSYKSIVEELNKYLSTTIENRDRAISKMEGKENGKKKEEKSN